jgi:hypothetical protein
MEFKDLEGGDDVFTVSDGWTKVDLGNVSEMGHISILGTSYRKDGRLSVTDDHPSAWTYDPLNGSEPK